MSDFITDDHDHSHSVTSLSVQLFTVPTLAQYLMGHHEALAGLLRCFLGEIERRKNAGIQSEHFPRVLIRSSDVFIENI